MENATPKYENNILVVTLGCYGTGRTIGEAAANCHKAGASKLQPAEVLICDKPVKFKSALMVEYPDGAPNFQTQFSVRTLGAIL